MSRRCWASAALAVALLTSPLGLWVCSGITCSVTPDPAFAGYWRGGALLITVNAKPWAVLQCLPTSFLFARGETWETYTCE